MKKGLTLTFFFGLLIGGLAALLVWYYQKSTSAEDGALLLLDRLAATDRRVRALLAEQSGRQRETPQHLPLPIQVVTAPTDEVPSFLRKTETAVPEDLTVVPGIGPVFAARLAQAGIDTVSKLTAVSPAKLAEILQISESRAATVLAATQTIHR